MDGSLCHIFLSLPQIMLDDTEDADVLVHLLPSIHFIQAELDKGRGVLVHCQAGTLVSIGNHLPFGFAQYNV